MENFHFIEEFYSRGGAVSTERLLLYGVLKSMLDSPGQVQRVGSIAKELYENNSGASDRAIGTDRRNVESALTPIIERSLI